MEPILVNTVDISAAGKNCKVLLGDINGDGRMELVCVQANGGTDSRYVPFYVTCVTAFALTGEKLWQVGTPWDEPGGFGADFPAQIYDIDGDGKLEIIAVMADDTAALDAETAASDVCGGSNVSGISGGDSGITEGEGNAAIVNKNIVVIDGATGQIKRKKSVPAPEAHDCILIANLSGNPTAREIIVKDRYENMWALDENFDVKWTHSGNLGHFPLVYDINGDGRDEVMAGYDMLSADGEVMWSCKDLDDHADCLWIGDVNGDGKLEMCVGGSVTCLYDMEGNELWRYDGSIESQHIALGKYIPGAPGLQVAGLDRISRGDGYKGMWHGKDGMFLLDCNGKELWKEDRKTDGWLTIVNTYRNWNGEGKDYILAYRRGGGVMPALYDGDMNVVVSFPTDGYVVSADLFGRNIEDTVIYADGKAWIYSGTQYDLTQKPSGRQLPQTEKLFRSTLYPGCIYE